jgi:PAS domain S-box-containing protein
MNDNDSISKMSEPKDKALENKPLDHRLNPNEIQDITEQGRTEQALKESTALFRSLVENMLDSAVIIDWDGKILFANQSGINLVGLNSLHDALGANMAKFVHPDYLTKVVEDLNRVKNDQGGFLAEYKLVTIHGETKWIEALGNKIIFKGNTADLIILRDISERKIAEDALRKSEAQLKQAIKMEAIGTLAGGIAHDFNNLLMTIQGNTSLMRYDLNSDHPHYQTLEKIESAVKSGVKLTRQLLGYARKGQYEIKPLNLNRLTKEAADTIGRTRKDIAIRYDLSNDLSTIMADQSQMEQVMLNLFVNAADAMPDGGDLILQTSNVTDEKVKEKHHDPKAGSYVLLTVTDTGLGMDQNTRDRIFDPFFTTKEMGRGTGLGLASVYGIIKSHSGYIDVESKKNSGSTFSVFLPASDIETRKPSAAMAQVEKQSGTILIADDEELVLDVGIKLIEIVGYNALEAKNGREAVAVYQKYCDTIDLVILDMIMPDMSGGEAYDEIKKINPTVKALLSSGYSLDGRAKEILDRGCDGFIQKPYTLEELSAKINEILTGD